MQKNYSNFEQGDIVIATLMFSEQIGTKRRPALVISNKEYNSMTDDVIVLKVTSKVKDYPFDVELKENDLESGMLKYESVIQADFPVVIDKDSITQKIGKVSEEKLQEVKQKIRELYGL